MTYKDDFTASCFRFLTYCTFNKNKDGIGFKPNVTVAVWEHFRFKLNNRGEPLTGFQTATKWLHFVTKIWDSATTFYI